MKSNHLLIKSNVNNKLVNETIPEIRDVLVNNKVMPEANSENFYLSTGNNDSDTLKLLFLLNKGIHFTCNFGDNSINSYGYRIMYYDFPPNEEPILGAQAITTTKQLYKPTSGSYSRYNDVYDDGYDWTQFFIDEYQEGYYNGYYRYGTIKTNRIEIPIAPAYDYRQYFLQSYERSNDAYTFVTDQYNSYQTKDTLIANNSPDIFGPNVSFLINFINLGGKVTIHIKYNSLYNDGYYYDLSGIFVPTFASRSVNKYTGPLAMLGGIFKSNKSDACQYMKFAI